MKLLWVFVILLAVLLGTEPSPVVASDASVAVPAPPAQEVFHFTGVTLRDGNASYAEAEIFVRVRESAAGGYTRADYLDREGERLGFYEAFEIVSHEEAALRTWAIRNFPDRTSSTR